MDEPFITWPMQSPTSLLGINVRFYAVDEDETVGARYRVDLGAAHEAMLEKLYDDFGLAEKNISHRSFEDVVRGLFQQRIAFVTAYAVATALYVSFTNDPSEMGRLTQREKRVLASQRRRFPYTAYSQYQTLPTSVWGKVKWFFGSLRARLFH